MRYKVLIVGAGLIGAFFDIPGTGAILSYAHAFSVRENFELKGFYDTDYNKALKAAQTWNCHAYQDMNSAMEGVDIVCCCVPDGCHSLVLKEIFRYTPKFVITEKPLAANVKEAEAIQSLYANKIPVLLNYSRRFLHEFQELRRNIPNMGQFIRGMGYYGKGLCHNGSHMLDLVMFLLGNVQKINGVASQINDYGEKDYSCDVDMSIANGKFQMHAVDCRLVTIFELDLLFEKCRVRILDGGSLMEVYEVQESDMYKGYYNYKLSKKKIIDYSNAMLGLLTNVEEFLNDSCELRCTLEDGIRVLQLCEDIRGMT